ncbi:MAG: hypothetical protein U0838_10390 [Chloroflexota bacterium]
MNRFVANFIGVSNPIEAKLVSHDRATGRAAVESDRRLRLPGTITDTNAAPAAGMVHVAVRPERIRVEATHAADVQPGWTRIEEPHPPGHLPP